MPSERDRATGSPPPMITEITEAKEKNNACVMAGKCKGVFVMVNRYPSVSSWTVAINHWIGYLSIFTKSIHHRHETVKNHILLSYDDDFCYIFLLTN